MPLRVHASSPWVRDSRDIRFQYDLAFAASCRLQATAKAFCSSAGAGRQVYAAS